MSIKTLRKRIALVAVSALGAGVLSVAVAPSANAAAIAAGASNLDATTDLASTVPGVCIAPTNATDTAVVDFNRVTGGITLLVTDGTDDLGNDEVGTFTITGPAVFTVAGTAANGATRSLAADGKKITYTADADGSADTMLDPDFRLTGAGKVEIKVALTTAAGSTTVLDTFTIYSVAACDQGGYSATTSVTYLDDTNSTALNATTAAAVTGDDATAAVKKYSETTYLKLFLTDKYGAAIDTTASYIEAAATNGAIVGINGTPTSPTAVATSSIQAAVVHIKLPSTTAPVQTTVTVKFNGTTVATRTVTFTGQPASVVVSGVASHVATTGTDSINFVVRDSAGNQLAGWTPVAGLTTSDVNGASVTAFGGASSATTVQTATLTAGSVEGASSTTIRVKLDDGTYVTSAPIAFFTTTATAASWTISADKQIYAPGEVVTITVEAKNAKGNPVADTTVLASASGTLSWTGAGLTKVSADPAHTDTATGGKWTYKFYASTTEGSYGYSLKSDMAAAITTAQTGTFTVKSGAISNAEVLASIVKLIAAINKQIRALQKSLRR